MEVRAGFALGGYLALADRAILPLKASPVLEVRTVAAEVGLVHFVTVFLLPESTVRSTGIPRLQR